MGIPVCGDCLVSDLSIHHTCPQLELKHKVIHSWHRLTCWSDRWFPRTWPAVAGWGWQWKVGSCILHPFAPADADYWNVRNLLSPSPWWRPCIIYLSAGTERILCWWSSTTSYWWLADIFGILAFYDFLYPFEMQTHRNELILLRVFTSRDFLHPLLAELWDIKVSDRGRSGDS